MLRAAPHARAARPNFARRLAETHPQLEQSKVLPMQTVSWTVVK